MNVTYLAEANWDRLSGTLVDAIKDTLIMVATTMVLAGIIGLVLGSCSTPPAQAESCRTKSSTSSSISW